MRCFRRDGTRYDSMMDWARDFETADRIVAQETLPNGIFVSTVWLGLDHNFGQTNRPLIFETMLFVAQTKVSVLEIRGRKKVFVSKRESIGEQWRYSTEEEAIRGHKTLVKKWKTRKTAEEVLSGAR